MKQTIFAVFLAMVVGAAATFFSFPILLVVGVATLTYLGVNLMTSPVATKESLLSPVDSFMDYGPVKKRIRSLESSLNRLPSRLMAPVKEITLTAMEILEEIQKRPENSSSGRRYVLHYLESTQTIVDRYLHVKNNTQKEMTPLEEKLEILLVKVSKSFRNQRENLLEDDMLHLTTEMEVLEKTLELES